MHLQSKCLQPTCPEIFWEDLQATIWERSSDLVTSFADRRLDGEQFDRAELGDSRSRSIRSYFSFHFFWNRNWEECFVSDLQLFLWNANSKKQNSCSVRFNVEARYFVVGRILTVEILLVGCVTPQLLCRSFDAVFEYGVESGARRERYRSVLRSLLEVFWDLSPSNFDSLWHYKCQCFAVLIDAHAITTRLCAMLDNKFGQRMDSMILMLCILSTIN